MSDFHRGEIYYISRGGMSPQGSEQYPDRPAVIVSNEMNNEHSGTVEVVYMTTQPKVDLPTHVTIRSTGRTSTVLCEAVYTISTERVGQYISEVTEPEIQSIDIALMISLQLDGDTKTSKRHQEEQKRQQETIESLKEEIATLQQEITDYDARVEQMETDAAVYVEENKKVEQIMSRESMIRIESERDTYKALYESLLNRLVNGGAA